MQKTPHGAGLQQLPFALSQLEVGVLAEKVGFEPTVGYEPTHAFQACDLNHSSTSPRRYCITATLLPAKQGADFISLRYAVTKDR